MALYWRKYLTGLEAGISVPCPHYSSQLFRTTYSLSQKAHRTGCTFSDSLWETGNCAEDVLHKRKGHPLSNCQESTLQICLPLLQQIYFAPVSACPVCHICICVMSVQTQMDIWQAFHPHSWTVYPGQTDLPPFDIGLSGPYFFSYFHKNGVTSCQRSSKNSHADNR